MGMKYINVSKKGISVVTGRSRVVVKPLSTINLGNKTNAPKGLMPYDDYIKHRTALKEKWRKLRRKKNITIESVVSKKNILMRFLSLLFPFKKK